MSRGDTPGGRSSSRSDRSVGGRRPSRQRWGLTATRHSSTVTVFAPSTSPMRRASPGSRSSSAAVRPVNGSTRTSSPPPPRAASERAARPGDAHPRLVQVVQQVDRDQAVPRVAAQPGPLVPPRRSWAASPVSPRPPAPGPGNGEVERGGAHAVSAAAPRRRRSSGRGAAPAAAAPISPHQRGHISPKAGTVLFTAQPPADLLARFLPRQAAAVERLADHLDDSL
jgi:hypothetical protein